MLGAWHLVKCTAISHHHSLFVVIIANRQLFNNLLCLNGWPSPGMYLAHICSCFDVKDGMYL